MRVIPGEQEQGKEESEVTQISGVSGQCWQIPNTSKKWGVGGSKFGCLELVSRLCV